MRSLCNWFSSFVPWPMPQGLQRYWDEGGEPSHHPGPWLPKEQLGSLIIRATSAQGAPQRKDSLQSEKKNLEVNHIRGHIPLTYCWDVIGLCRRGQGWGSEALPSTSTGTLGGGFSSLKPPPLPQNRMSSMTIATSPGKQGLNKLADGEVPCSQV